MSHIFAAILKPIHSMFFFHVGYTRSLSITTTVRSTLFFSFFNNTCTTVLYGCDKCKKLFNFFPLFSTMNIIVAGNNNYDNGCRYQICYGLGEKKKNSSTRRRNTDDTGETRDTADRKCLKNSWIIKIIL